MRPDRVNILLVDDQPAKLLSYEAILAPLGENLIQASSGNEALERLLKTDIAVVLMDVSMPDLDGFELASMIHEHPRHRRAAIIFVSAIHVTDIDRLRGYEVGGVDYVSVPIEPDLLRARVSVFADLYRKTQQLEQLNAELERRVEERTAALEASTGRLRESEEMLRETDRRKDEFLAMLAHELRNPLAPIRNSVEYLRLKERDPELDWSYDVIDRQVDHLTRLVDDLLDVSRITRGKLEIRRKRVDLSEILRGALETIQPQITRKGQRLHVSIPPGPVELHADAVRMTQVLLNLLDNAVKFTPDGGTIWLTVEREDGHLRIRVRDQGKGLEPEDLPQLFQMFYQSRHTKSLSVGGLGIGLALVRRLVEMHGGTVEAASEGLGMGSEFAIRLPYADDRLEAGASRDIASEDATRPASRRILVVDDNRDSAESLALLLRLAGHEVIAVHDGLAAVETADSWNAEIVLLDIGLPEMDGYEVASTLRQRPDGKRFTLIAVTGWGQDADRRRSREAGFDAHLTKPVETTTLQKLLAAIPAADAAMSGP
ncbi:MAG TPA: response regulator [Candidatus Eisenbacteria bacterium]|nr:response regulator [Candidatus Eisenbacteria bacterium]